MVGVLSIGMSSMQPGDTHVSGRPPEKPAASVPPPDFRDVLASIDQQGRRRWLHVHLNGGFWRWCRVAVALVLIGFYLALPFLSIDGQPFLRIDIPHRHYVLLGQMFWPQDFLYLLLFLLIGAAATLLTVALAGRVFCGWLCPHTVFLEMVYRPLERLIQGVAARRAWAARLGRDRWRRVITWGAFVLISGALANTATAVFVGVDAFRWGLVVDPVQHPAAAVFFAVFFVLIMLNFVWLREQTCTIVCPYGRLQSVMLDPHSLVVAYDRARGEPRGKPGVAAGDCIDCRMCVAVCPTGIDIRNGNQMECVHCTACIDACDTVMTRIGRKPGLVRHDSEIAMAGGRRRIIRIRTVLYGCAVTALLTVATLALAHREPLVVSRLRTVVPPLVMAGEAVEPVIRQVVPLSLVNRTDHQRSWRLALPQELGGSIISPAVLSEIAGGARIEVSMVIDVPRSRFHDGELRTELIVVSEERTLRLPITLRAP
jgi:cytochrome c oxidase accessory protein FixG